METIFFDKWKVETSQFDNQQPEVGFEMSEFYSLTLPFEDQNDLDEAVKWLCRWRDLVCWRFSSRKDINENKLFHYFPVQQHLSMQEKMNSCPEDMNILSLRFAVAKRCIHEKPC